MAFAEVEEIDRVNIYWAGLGAMRRAIDALAPAAQHLLIDGRKLHDVPVPQERIVGGDGRSLSIAAASILAKTARDARMRELDAQFPGYGFAQHKGYPVAEHVRALGRLGACPVHRRSFVARARRSWVCRRCRPGPACRRPSEARASHIPRPRRRCRATSSESEAGRAGRLPLVGAIPHNRSRSPTMQSRRASPRIPYDEAVCLTPADASSRIYGRGLDLGTGGMYLVCTQSCPVGTEARCDLLLPGGPRPVTGRVVRVTPAPGGFELAIAFVDLKPGVTALIEEMVAHAMPAPAVDAPR